MCFGYRKFTKNTTSVSPPPIIECIPNFSEGRNSRVIQSIVEAMESVPAARILHVDIGYDANRTVITVAGPPQAVFASAEAGIRMAVDKIDMRDHIGEHPRIGAVDVCPFVVLRGISKSDLREAVDTFAERIARELGLPIYLYAQSARNPGRFSLAAIRKGQYEGLKKKMVQAVWIPDYGPKSFHPGFGAMAVGVRDLMIAYNVHLKTTDVTIARRIAADLRGSGRWVLRKGKRVQQAGRFSALKAIGWWMASYGWAQVSMNVMDFREAPLHEVYEAVSERARAYGISVQGSELIGLAPEEALRAAGHFYAKRAGESAELSEDQWMSYAVRGLGLDRLGPMDLKDRIIEYTLRS